MVPLAGVAADLSHDDNKVDVKGNVMEVGKGKYEPKKWPLGEEEIDSCEQYRYLGDVIMRDGGNKKNIEDLERLKIFWWTIVSHPPKRSGQFT